MSLIQTKKVTAETTRTEIEEVITIYKGQIKDLNHDLEHGEMTDVTWKIAELERDNLRKNAEQLEAILAQFYEAKCEMCQRHQKMEFRTYKFICGLHDPSGKEVIMQL